LSQLSLTVLGGPQVRLAGRALAFRTRKALALLIYLAVEGGSHPRDQLADLFWPESDSAKGRSMVRTSLAHLRQALLDEVGEYVLAEGESLRFNPQSDYELDLKTIEAALGGTATGLERLAVLEAAVTVYRGDFLAGFSLADTPDFDGWASQQREAWHRRFSVVLDRLSQLQSEGGELELALQTAARWANHDPLDEAAYRRLMQLQFASGGRTQALQTFEAARATLKRELGVEAGPELVALAKRIQHEASVSVPKTSAQPTPAPSEALATLPMVGRVNEFAQLIALSYSIRKGATQVVSLEGEAGIGKTRLATEFINWALADGLDVWQGRAFETGGHLPYQPLVAALRQRLERENAPDDLLGDVWLAELSRLLPELRERYPDLPQPLGVGEGEAQTRLFEAVARWGLAAAQRSPVVLLVDDVQWADSASLDLLNYSLQRWAEAYASILVMFTLRSESLNTIAPWLAGLGRTLAVTRLSLNSLTQDHTQQLVQGLTQAPSQADLHRFSQWLFSETDGQPFFVVELLKALSERGDLNSALAAGGSSASLPSSVRDLVSARLARLTPAAADLLTAGAVLGQTAEFETLCEVAAVPEPEGLRALDELLAARLLAELPVAIGDPARYVFAHDKIRDVIYSEAGEARRRVFHRRAVGVLEGQFAPPATLAHHALAGGLGERAFHLSVAAGDEALRLFAVTDAIQHYAAAEQLLAGAARSASAETQHHLYRQLGRTYELNNDRPTARVMYERMLLAARRLENGAMETTALNRLATLASQEANYERAFALLNTAQTVAEASGDRLGLVETDWALAQLDIYHLDCKAAYTHGWHALALARETGETELIARCLNVVAFAEKGLAKPEAIPHAREAASLYASLGNVAMQADSLTLWADALVLNGQVAEGLPLAHESLRLSEQIGNVWGQANNLLHIAYGLAHKGEYEAALEAAKRALVLSGNTPYVPLFTQALLGSLYRSILNLDLAYETHLDLMQKALALEYPPGFLAMIAAELCADCVVAERWDEALTYAKQAVTHRNYEVLPAGHAQWPETVALVRAGEIDLARQDIDAFQEGLGHYRRHAVSTLRALAVLAQAQGNDEQARVSLLNAIALAEEIGLLDDVWQLHLMLGEVERARERLRPLVAGITDVQLRETFVANLVRYHHLDL